MTRWTFLLCLSLLCLGTLSTALAQSTAAERRIYPLSVGATDFVNMPQDNRVFPPGDASDGNLATYWSCAQPGPCEIVWELWGYDYTGIDLLFYHGAQRSFLFDVLVSNGDQWTPVLTGVSSARRDGYQHFSFPKTFGIYIKVIGYGNDSSTKSAQIYTSLVEARFYAYNFMPQ